MWFSYQDLPLDVGFGLLDSNGNRKAAYSTYATLGHQDDDTITVGGQPISNEVLVGTTSAEVLNGTNVDSLIEARSGNDTVRGYGGNDTLKGGAGNDYVSGGKGNDKIYGEGGNDVLAGGDGADIFIFTPNMQFGPNHRFQWRRRRRAGFVRAGRECQSVRKPGLRAYRR